MAVFKCKMCGGSLEVAEGLSVATCEYCGTTQTLPRLSDDKIANLYDRANHFRRSNDYDKAMGIYEQILNEDSSDSEAYWSLVLCRYGIEYVEDPATKKRIPTVNRAQFTSIFSDEDYKSALQYADDEQKAIYEEEAKTIDNIQKGILEISNNEEPFDVFICYKETDNNGRRTPDSVLANDLYHQLTAEGFKVFFAAITLEDKLGSAYEPYIFAALNSAKVMVVLGTKPEFFNAVWVKNEWSRYLALIRGGAKKMLIPAYKDMDPYDLPEEFSHLQAQDMSKLGFMQDLIRGIKKIVSADTAKESIKDSIANNNTGVEATIDRAILLIEDGENEKADELLEQALNVAPKHPMIYVGKLMLETGVRKQDELASLDDSFENSPHYEKAIRFANPQLKAALESYIATIKANNVKATYDEAVAKMKGGISEEDFLYAKDLFDSISNYADAKELSATCTEKAVVAKKEAIYKSAVKLMNADNFDKLGDLQKAIDKFTSIKDYKDSEDKIDECERKVVAEKENIAKKKKRNKTIALIVTPIILVAIVVAVIYATVIVPKQNYGKAEELFAAQNYSQAYDMYAKLGNYEDSAEKAKECLYIQAVAYRNDKNWDAANPLFEQIKGYKDSDTLIHYHDYKLVDSKDATCDVAGYKKYKCTCGYENTETISALGHNYSSATCTEAAKCSRCGKTDGSALGHTSGGTKCERCGVVTFTTLSYSGAGDKLITGINLPNGRFKITLSVSSDGYNYFYLMNSNDQYLANCSIDKDSSANSEESEIFSGPLTNGYLDITGNRGTWKITIEAF